MPPCVGVGWVSRYGAGSKAVVKGTSRKGKTMAEIRSISTNMQPDFWVYSCEEGESLAPTLARRTFAKAEQQEIKGKAGTPGTGRGGEEAGGAAADRPGRQHRPGWGRTPRDRAASEDSSSPATTQPRRSLPK